MGESMNGDKVREYNQIDEVRRELDGKIDRKVSKFSLFWFVGAAVPILIGILGYLFIQSIDNSKDIAVIKVLLDEQKKKTR
jgi:hypothetical protein